MRWGKKEVVIYRDGATRTVERFLWLPTNLPVGWGHTEWRWLERATIEQTWHTEYTDPGGPTGGRQMHAGWSDTRFVDDKEKARAARSAVSRPGERPLG